MSVLDKVSALSSMLSSDNGSYFDPPLESYAAPYFNDVDEIQAKLVMKKPNEVNNEIIDNHSSGMTDRYTFESNNKKAGSVLQQRSGSFEIPAKKHKESTAVNAPTRVKKISVHRSESILSAPDDLYQNYDNKGP
jgi:hypothetical protein